MKRSFRLALFRIAVFLHALAQTPSVDVAALLFALSVLVCLP